ncbi:MAG: ferritin family protein [Candidatus Omnitrophota bacterium]
MKIEEKNGKLSIVDFDEIEAYKIASKIEQDGIDFYKSLAAKADSQQTKETLNFLIEEEKKHLKFFQNCLFPLRQDKGDLFEEDDLFKVMDYGIFIAKNSEELKAIISKPKKALEFGLAIEDKSIKFYSSCRDFVGSSASKQEISKIIREEEKHKLLLQDLLNKA